MNAKHQPPVPDMTSQIDRLVCGELDDASRQHLLDWFEQDPIRWRQCGLAFLEAQEWSRALGGANFEVGTLARDFAGHVPTEKPAASTTKQRPVGRKSAVSRVAFAACLLAAFCLGASVRGWLPLAPLARNPVVVIEELPDSRSQLPQRDAEDAGTGKEPLIATVNVRANAAHGEGLSLRVPVMPQAAAANATELDASERISDSLREECERKGYSLSLERRYMFARLSDGRQIAVPVEQLRLNPRPLTVY